MLGEEPTKGGADDRTGDAARLQYAESPPHAFPRGRNGHERHRGGNDAGDKPVEKAENEEFARRMHERHEGVRNRHPKSGAQNHELSTHAVRKRTPDRRHDKGGKKAHAVDRSGPEVEVGEFRSPKSEVRKRGKNGIN